MSGISSWSIRNPVPTIVLFVALTGAGLLGFSGLRQNNTPDMDIPTVTVSVQRTGAAASEMETQVTRLVEGAVAGLGNVDHIRSTVSQGSSSTSVEFAIGIDGEKASNDVRNAVSAIRASLPSDILEPVVRKVEATGQSIVGFVVEAPGLAPDALSWFVDNDVAKAVLAVRGVSRIERQGGVDREIQVRVDPDRAMALGLTVADVSRELRSVNVDQPGGRANLGAGEQQIRTTGSVRTVEALADTRVALADGSARLGDVAEVTSTWAEPRQRARLDGREVVGFSVYRTVGSSEVAVGRAVRARVAGLQAASPGVAIREVTSSTAFVEEGYLAAVEALLIGGLLAVAVVWLFLRDLRATLVSSVALPLSLIPTFAVMRMLDQSLNNITLLAIALVVGVLVDDAIVEVENIVRHMRLSGKDAYRSAIEAADEIGLAVVATTLTIVAVFLPVGFMPGIPGQFFRAFALAVCVSVLFSLLVARTLTPMMAAYLMRSGGAHHGDDEPRWMPAYQRLLGATLDWPRTTVVAGICLFVASISLARHIPTDFIPASDRGRSMLAIELPPGSTLAETDAVVLRAGAALRRRPEVAGVFAAMGTPVSSGPGGGGGSSGEVRIATLTVNLVPKGSRALSQQAFEAAVGPELRAIPGARFRFGADGQSGAKAQATLVSDDSEALDRALEALAAGMCGVPGFENVASTASLALPEIRVTPRRDEAAMLGVNATDLAQTVNIATVGDNSFSLPKFNLVDRQVDIRVLLAEDVRGDLDRLAALQVRAGTISLPLAAVADLSFGAGPNQITRLDRRRTATVETQISGMTAGQANAAILALPAMRDLPAGVSSVAGGDVERMAELFKGFAVAIGSGIALVYLVLVLLFNGFLQPVTILTALPLSLGGALALMMATGSSFSISALIGILMLMGIAAKNSILLVEYAIVARRDGVDRRQALLDAARKRARPIVMTTVAMGAGMLPIALKIGADAEFRAPMAVAVIGGLLSSTVLSLVYVPAVYTLVDGLHVRLGRILGRLVTKRAPEPAALSGAH